MPAVVWDEPVSLWSDGREDLGRIGYWATLGAAAGGLGGFLIGGIGGRVAMFVLRLTSDQSVRGIESDDGFTIGRFDLLSTLSLLFVTTVMGVIVGLVVVFGRPFFPHRGMPLAWGLAGAIAGGAILVHGDGIDFTLLEPRALAVALFIAIPALGAAFIAWLTEIYPRFWWRRRRLTFVTGIALVPGIVFFPVAVAATLVAGAWWLTMRVPRFRTVPSWKPARLMAAAVFVLVVALGLVDLTKDVQAIL